jgi:hypothetical protein
MPFSGYPLAMKSWGSFWPEVSLTQQGQIPMILTNIDLPVKILRVKLSLLEIWRVKIWRVKESFQGSNGHPICVNLM